MQVFHPIETILPNSDDNPSFLPAQSNCLAPLWAGRQFSQAISLGSFCHSAQILREVEYRAFSGPFDWIFSSPGITAHILQDDFNLFLDPEYYEPVPLELRQSPEAISCDHRFYRDKFGVRFMFNHHSPDSAKDHAYFKRAVQRFRAALAHSPPPLLLMVTFQPFRLNRFDPILRALNGFGQNYGVLVVRFVVSENGMEKDPKTSGHIKVIHHDETVLTVELQVSKQSDGVCFPNAEDNRRFFDLIKSFRVTLHPFPQGNFLVQSDFDDAWYLSQNPDVAEAVKVGMFASGWEHYQQHGKREGRPGKYIDL
ncbi:DUF1796 family putative cysteine peptidase [Nitrosomonas sp. Is37]|uniref:DUF1796 family putative cysteine peptidase n=1 Tax=Nitrosomonas sp. Is37 TaxID=3080535 RepID=UPI00294ADBC8|nr:DUF1796 family putative cysteine peptidase [Nitrosomonas sp. Is37]MDV6345089.1 DUF1796 family putative cysteine peptidase [Nitrosomonas sp. Is37]